MLFKRKIRNKQQITFLYNLFKPQTINSGIHFKVHCKVDEIVGDPTKIKQILTNLLCNSFKFTHTGQVCLQVNRDRTTTKSEIIFSVIDTGIGIESSKLDRVFEPFLQEDNSIRRRYGGTGLGLSICKKLVELMGDVFGFLVLGKIKGRPLVFLYQLERNSKTLTLILNHCKPIYD